MKHTHVFNMTDTVTLDLIISITSIEKHEKCGMYYIYILYTQCTKRIQENEKHKTVFCCNAQQPSHN